MSIFRYTKRSDEVKEDHEAKYQEALKKYLEKGGKIKRVKVTDEFIREALKPKKRKRAPKNKPRKKK